MHTLEGFTPVGEIAADERARVALGKAGEARARYAVSTNADGEILLTPLASVPKREAWLYRNPKALQSLLIGLAQSAAGQTMVLDEDFSQYVDLDIEDDEDDEDRDAARDSIDGASDRLSHE